MKGKEENAKKHMNSERYFDYSGMRFGSIEVIQFAFSKNVGKTRKRFFECRCDCGKTVYFPADKLNNKYHRSCGCNKHPGNFGKKYDVPKRLYNIYHGMLCRCKSSPSYKKLGISVCESWAQNPKTFFEWAIQNGYQDDLSIDRINPFGNYEPSNCRWADTFTQSNNKTDSTHITINGITHTAKEWEVITGVKAGTIRTRARYGKTGADLIAPTHRGGNYAKS